MSRRKIIVVMAALFVIVLPRTAWANIIAPSLVPGVAPFFGLLAIPATILAALCESPFVRRAGVRRQPLFHSFNANLISTGVGFLLIPIAAPAFFITGGISALFAIALSIWIEGTYYKKLRMIHAEGLRWSWLIWGNLASVALLIVISVAAHVIETPFRAEHVRTYWWPLVLATIAGGAAGFLLGLRDAVKSERYDHRGSKPPVSQEKEAQQCEIGPLSTAVPTATSSDDFANSEQPQYPAPPGGSDG